MKYITVKEAAQKFGINELRVRLLCEQGRIEGAYKEGKVYLIPEASEKPSDQRKTENKKSLTINAYPK